MAIALLHATNQALGKGLLPECDSRSLFATRFADPQAKEGERKQWFNALIKKNATQEHPLLSWLPPHADVLRAQLLARLMVNLAGGVMENANLLFDRYGYPLIPGSAVKGCARRMALQTLHDWLAEGGAPASAGEFCGEDITLPCRADFETPAHLLAAIARVFGWVKQDWSDQSDQSDFFWACRDDNALLAAARALLPPHETFAGTVAFLPASPNKDPRLELDVVTPHHTKYYSGDAAFSDAPDTEDPVPVFFPAVAPQKDGDHFSFPLIPLPQGAWASCPPFTTQTPLELAKLWLAHGLELFGLGAKTNVGYGWFAVLNEQLEPAHSGRFEPRLSETDAFLKSWGGKPVNSMNARPFARLVYALKEDSAVAAVFRCLIPDKLGDFKDSFWNPLKLDPTGKLLIERLKSALL